MEAKLTIQERLKDLRVVDRGLSLEQLAEQTGLSKSALGKYEAEDFKDISPFAIVTLAKFYGVSTDYLLGLTENKNPANAELQALHHRGINILSAVSRANQHGSDRLAGLWQYVYRHTRPSFVLIQI